MTALLVIAGLLGITLTGIEVYGCVQYLLAQEAGWSYLVAGGAIMPICAPVLAVVRKRCWHGHKLQSLTALALLCLCIAGIVLAALERTSAAKDRDTAENTSTTAKKDAAGSMIPFYEKALATAEKIKTRDCKTGTGSLCKNATNAEAKARADLADAKQTAAGIQPVVDSKPELVAAMTKGYLTADDVRMYEPALVPVTISLLALFLTSFSLHGLIERVQSRAPQPAAMPVTIAPNVVTLQPVDPPKQLRAAPPKQRIARFLVEQLEPSEGAATEVAEIYRCYKAWCAKQQDPPLSASEFGDRLYPALHHAKIATREDGDHVYCVNVKLAS